MGFRDGAPEIREPVIWVLTRLGGSAPRSLSAHKLSTCGNCWLNVGVKVRRLLFIARPSQEVHDKCPHEGLIRDETRQNCRLNYFLDKIFKFT